MIIIHFLLLFVNLILLKCASTEDQNETIQVENSENRTTSDIISRHLNAELLHLVLEYVAYSRGRIAKANRALRKLATASRTYRFYEVAGRDMPELANIWKSGVTYIRDMAEFESEKSKIFDLFKIEDDTILNETLEHLLLNKDVFKKLARYVLKYLIRRIYEKVAKEKAFSEYSAERYRCFEIAVKNRYYDVFFELSKDPNVWINHADIDDDFLFHCYNNYVYNSSSSSSRYMWNNINSIHAGEYNGSRVIDPDWFKLSRREANIWIAVCIHRRSLQDQYTSCLSDSPTIFLDIIEEYISMYSLITFDHCEKERYHEFICQLLEKHFGDNDGLKERIKFTRFLNDVRYGNGNESIDGELDKLERRQIVMLTLAVSKSNNKSLVKQLSALSNFKTWILESMVDIKCPHRFKVYFDLIEGEPLQDINEKVNLAGTKLIQTIISNKFKIAETITLSFGIKFQIQSPPKYIDLGFASQYEIVLDQKSQKEFVQSLIQKMFEDAAKAGAEELIQLITSYCGEQVNTSNIIHNSRIFVSFEVIQILIQHRYLIVMLENCRVLLFCDDERINDDDISNFKHVIIKRQRLF